MTAGAALIDEAQRLPYERNLLLYPILFNYRHGLEVAMKWTIERYGRLATVKLDKRDHDLLALWRKCRTIFESVPSERIGREGIEAVERIVKYLHTLIRAENPFATQETRTAGRYRRGEAN